MNNIDATLSVYAHCFGFRFQFRERTGYDVFSFIDDCAEMGFSGVCLPFFPPESPFLGEGDDPYPFIEREDQEHLAKIRERLEANELAVDLETGSTDPEHLKRALAIAGLLGATSLRTYTDPFDDEQEQLEVATSNLSAVADHAAASGIEILLENHEEESSAQVAEILRRVDHPSVGALFDYANSMLFMEEPLESLLQLEPWVRTAHMKDHAVLAPAGAQAAPRFIGVALGEGSVPVLELTKRLIQSSVKRIVFENVWGYEAAFRDRRGEATMGAGAFTFLGPPYDPERCLADAELASAERGLDLTELERGAIDRSLVWLNQACAAAGIALERGQLGALPAASQPQA